MMPTLIILMVALLCTTTTSGAKQWAVDEQDIHEVSSWIEGSYSNERQAKQDTSFQHQRIEIRRIWMDRQDGVWFVMERFVAGMEDKPIRWVEERVLHIHGVEENLTEVRIFRWKDVTHESGLWKNPDKAAEYTPSDLLLLRGCELYLQRNSSAFFGGTHGMACSTGWMVGVSYKTITISIANQSMALWERGFSADNKQIWGSEKGPYYYLKQKL